jgi:two-component system, OmpR family, KDP operon response regulator KdpE
MSLAQQAILVIDDEAPMRKYVGMNLKARGYHVLLAADGAEALELVAKTRVDLLLLDIGLPGLDGLSVLSAVRREAAVPVLMVSARAREGDKVRALDLGADDYLTKPFGVDELLARVRALLRRADPVHKHASPGYRSGDLEVDFSARRVTRNGQEVTLTPRQYDVLAYLADNAGTVVTHREILQAVWGPHYGDESEYVWTYVQRLRHQIEPDPANPRLLLTEPGVGYFMRAAD